MMAPGEWSKEGPFNSLHFFKELLKTFSMLEMRDGNFQIFATHLFFLIFESWSKCAPF